MRHKVWLGWASLSALAAVLACLALPDRVEATYPGRNGQLGGLAWRADGFSMLAREYPDGLLTQFHRVPGSWVRFPMYSPRGTRLVYYAFSVLGEGSVHVTAWNGGGDHVIRHGQFQTLSWSSDGRQIFGSFGCVDCPPVIYAFNSDGSGGVRTLAPFPAGTTAPGGAGDPEESPNGKEIVFLTDMGSREPEIWSMHPDASHLTRLTFTHNETDVELYKSRPDWSPDSSEITFSEELQNSSGAVVDKVVVMDADGSHQRRIATGVSPLFAPTGRFILYEADDGTMRRIDPDGTNDRPYPYTITSTYQASFAGPPLTWQSLPGTKAAKLPVTISFTAGPAEIHVRAVLGPRRAHERVTARLWQRVGARWVLRSQDTRLTGAAGNYSRDLNQQLSGTCLLRFHYYGDPRYLPRTVARVFTCHRPR